MWAIPQERLPTSRRLSAALTRWVPCSCSTHASPCRTSKWISTLWTSTSPHGAPTKCAARPASDSSMASVKCLRHCLRPISADPWWELAWMDQEAQYMEPPARFEAGTQPVAQVVAAGVAAEWLMNIGMENLEAHERTITIPTNCSKWAISTASESSDPAPTRSASVPSRSKSKASPARRRPVHRRAGHRHPRRTPLRAAGAPPLRRVCLQPRVQRHLQFGRRRAGPLIEALGKVRPFFGVE